MFDLTTEGDEHMVFFTSFDNESTVKNIYLSQDDKRALMIDSDDNFMYVFIDQIDKPQI